MRLEALATTAVAQTILFSLDYKAMSRVEAIISRKRTIECKMTRILSLKICKYHSAAVDQNTKISNTLNKIQLINKKM
jgi:hypothetical protein